MIQVINQKYRDYCFKGVYMLTRYKNWLSEYEFYTSGHEVPALYHKWVGLGLIACVLKQNV